MYTEIVIKKDLELGQLKYRYGLDIVDGMKDVAVYNNTLKVPFPYFISDAVIYVDLIKKFEAQHGVQKEWAIISNNKMIGAIGLHYDRGLDAHISEIGYWLHKDYRGQGWMTMVLKSFANHVFKTTELEKLKATVFAFNQASIRSLENAGFISEGSHLKEYKKDHKLIDAISYGLCK